MSVNTLRFDTSSYANFRIVFGLYLTIHFAQLLPWGVELFSDQGVLPDATASPLLFLFPNVFALNDSPLFVSTLLVFAIVVSVMFTVGICDRPAALALWYVLACLFGRNPLIANPSLPYVGFLLLAHFFRRTSPQQVYAVIWILMALSYSYSGYAKLSSPSWLDGSAVEQILNNPLARPTVIRHALLTLPSVLLLAATWFVLAVELLFAPFSLFRRLRPFLWAMMLTLHLSLIVLIDFADLSWGMVMVHLYTFDHRMTKYFPIPKLKWPLHRRKQPDEHLAVRLTM